MAALGPQFSFPATGAQTMATATKQLESIYQEITRQFAGNRLITVAPLDGDPPEKYEITYHLLGIYKDDSGEIQNRDDHIVTISIPFGFPHFPPSCKPKTPIFHPDFDPAAICIGDFWEKDRTIGDLILHIGQMITGHIFSTSNAFNEEAAKWYKDNPGRLPFDHQKLSAGDSDTDNMVAHTPSDDDVTLLLDDEEDEADEIVPSFDDSLFDTDKQRMNL
jgi:ubiquitin-protein ligase